MRTLLALAVVLGACGGDDVEPQFEMGPCDFGSAGQYVCQAACRSPVTPTGGGCESAHTVQDGETVVFPCLSSLEWQGLEGCCVNSGKTVLFFQCD